MSNLDPASFPRAVAPVPLEQLSIIKLAHARHPAKKRKPSLPFIRERHSPRFDSHSGTFYCICGDSACRVAFQSRRRQVEMQP